MVRVVIVLLLSVFAETVFAQNQLVFVHKPTGQSVRIREGNKVSLLYKGYNGQQEFVREIITQITDSTVTVGYAKQIKPGKRPNRICKTIYLRDITGFRKMSVGRLLAKSALSVGSVFGSYYMIRGLYTSSIASGYSIIASFGIGLAVIELNELIFPENIKYYTEDDWQLIVTRVP